MSTEGGYLPSIVLTGVFAGWVFLSLQSRAKANLASRASQLIGAGQLSQAGAVLGETFRGLCVHKAVLLMACHNLAVILQKQGQWLGCWQLCELVRWWAGRGVSGIRVVSEAVRADCSLAMNNLNGAYESLSALSGMSLSVTERLGILQAEIVYAIRAGRSETVMGDLPSKVSLARLMPTEQAGLVHGWLALAAHLSGECARRDWLWLRATLYRPEEELLAAFPGLAEVARAVSTDN